MSTYIIHGTNGCGYHVKKKVEAVHSGEAIAAATSDGIITITKVEREDNNEKNIKI